MVNHIKKKKMYQNYTKNNTKVFLVDKNRSSVNYSYNKNSEGGSIGILNRERYAILIIISIRTVLLTKIYGFNHSMLLLFILGLALIIVFSYKIKYGKDLYYNSFMVKLGWCIFFFRFVMTLLARYFIEGMIYCAEQGSEVSRYVVENRFGHLGNPKLFDFRNLSKKYWPELLNLTKDTVQITALTNMYLMIDTATNQELFCVFDIRDGYNGLYSDSQEASYYYHYTNVVFVPGELPYIRTTGRMLDRLEAVNLNDDTFNEIMATHLENIVGPGTTYSGVR